MLTQRWFRNLTRIPSEQGFSRLGFLVRVVLYGGVTASLALIWQVGIADDWSEVREPVPLKTTDSVPLKDAELLFEAIVAQKQYYRDQKRFQVPQQWTNHETESANYRQKIWSASDTGPFQAIDGQVFPPNFLRGAIFTGESKQPHVPHYIAAVFVVDTHRFIGQGCQTFSELQPWKMVMVGKAGAERLPCPEGTIPIEGWEAKLSEEV